jgi:hypothetical protein
LESGRRRDSAWNRLPASGTGIFIGAIERQRPETGRRPQEHDQEQNERLKPDASCRDGSATGYC